jgi:hypothetical protein
MIHYYHGEMRRKRGRYVSGVEGNAFEGCGLHRHFENGDGDLLGKLKIFDTQTRSACTENVACQRPISLAVATWH